MCGATPTATDVKAMATAPAVAPPRTLLTK